MSMMWFECQSDNCTNLFLEIVVSQEKLSDGEASMAVHSGDTDVTGHGNE